MVNKYRRKTGKLITGLSLPKIWIPPVVASAILPDHASASSLCLSVDLGLVDVVCSPGSPSVYTANLYNLNPSCYLDIESIGVNANIIIPALLPLRIQPGEKVPLRLDSNGTFPDFACDGSLFLGVRAKSEGGSTVFFDGSI